MLLPYSLSKSISFIDLYSFLVLPVIQTIQDTSVIYGFVIFTFTPQAITFHRCKNLKVKDIMMVNSQQMHVAFTNCVRVVASDLKVTAPGGSPNTDGIHISKSTRVQIKDSVIETGLLFSFSTFCPFSAVFS